MSTAAFPHVPGLEAYWAHATRRTAVEAPPPMLARLLLDTLGLGIEQTGRFLGSAPSFEVFTAWIVAQAGLPDPLALDRYRAWYEGQETPEAILTVRSQGYMAGPDLVPVD